MAASGRKYPIWVVSNDMPSELDNSVQYRCIYIIHLETDFSSNPLVVVLHRNKTAFAEAYLCDLLFNFCFAVKQFQDCLDRVEIQVDL